MATVRSNLGEIESCLSALARPVDFRKKRLGATILDALADRIQQRTVGEQTDPSGRPLAPLKASTLRRKRRKGYPDTIGVETGDMLQQSAVRGRQSVTDTQASMRFGLTEEQEAKATYFQEGKPGRQRARPFYDLDRRDEAALDGMIDGAIEDTIREQGG